MVDLKLLRLLLYEPFVTIATGFHEAKHLVAFKF